MKTKFKTSKGITLIALVITIIILLILAGVSIAMLTGQNGILTQAQKAKEQTSVAEEKEQIALAYNGAVTEKQSTDVTADDLNKQFDLNGVTDATASGENPITVTFDSGNQYTVENGVITGPTVANIVATMRIEGEKSTADPTVPEGFKHTEGTVNDGFVIKDNTNGNEFVWVPVDKNQKIKINITSKEDITSITLQDPYGDNIALSDTDNLGTSYTNDNVEPTINGVYKLTVVAGGETKETDLDVYSLYATRMWELDMLREEIKQEMGENYNSYLENYFGTSDVEEIKNMVIPSYKNEIFKDTENYLDLVNKDGGFYIGRYEASGSGETVEVKGNVMPRNNISQGNALTYSENMYKDKGITSSLLTGAAWDRTLGWLKETGQVTLFEIVGDSKTWGNYLDDTFSGTTESINTGSKSETQKNHIYDLAGNLSEWTTEASSTSGRVIRGR